MNRISKLIISAIIFFVFLLLPFKNLSAHCDGIDGPVVKAAKKALKTGNVNLVLIWVQENDEKEIKDAFQKTLHVRALGNEAQELADSYFFETLVRIHRAGEGEPYTGLKPAGRDLGPVIPAADNSIEENSLRELKQVFDKKKLSISEIEKLFNEVIKHKAYSTDDIEAGRKYVRSYVEFLHTAEHIYTAENSVKHKHN